MKNKKNIKLSSQKIADYKQLCYNQLNTWTKYIKDYKVLMNHYIADISYIDQEIENINKELKIINEEIKKINKGKGFDDCILIENEKYYSKIQLLVAKKILLKEKKKEYKAKKECLKKDLNYTKRNIKCCEKNCCRINSVLIDFDEAYINGAVYISKKKATPKIKQLKKVSKEGN